MPTLYPRVEFSGGRHYIVIANATDYAIPDEPEKVLGLLYHIAGKRWATGEFMGLVIEHIARIRGWDIHR